MISFAFVVRRICEICVFAGSSSIIKAHIQTQMCHSQSQTLSNALISLKEPLIRLPQQFKLSNDGNSLLANLTLNIEYVLYLINTYTSTTKSPTRIQKLFLAQMQKLVSQLKAVKLSVNNDEYFSLFNYRVVNYSQMSPENELCISFTILTPVEPLIVEIE